MNLEEKIRHAQIVAPALLDHSPVDLANELAERGLRSLIGDEDFARMIADRVVQCEECGEWRTAECECLCDLEDEWY